MSDWPQSGAEVSPGGDRRTVTVTFGYRGTLRTLVAPTLGHALEDARRRWGRWSTIESISNPNTIWADVTGRTRARHQPGIPRGGSQTTRSKLEAIGYHPLPGEIGGVRHHRDELPRRFNDPNAPHGESSWSPRQQRRRRQGRG